MYGLVSANPSMLVSEVRPSEIADLWVEMLAKVRVLSSSKVLQDRAPWSKSFLTSLLANPSLAFFIRSLRLPPSG